MVVGIIQIIIGAIFYIVCFITSKTEYVTHQTVKTLWILIGSIFLCFGVITIIFSKAFNDIMYYLNSIDKNLSKRNSYYKKDEKGTE